MTFKLKTSSLLLLFCTLFSANFLHAQTQYCSGSIVGPSYVNCGASVTHSFNGIVQLPAGGSRQIVWKLYDEYNNLLMTSPSMFNGFSWTVPSSLSSNILTLTANVTSIQRGVFLCTQLHTYKVTVTPKLLPQPGAISGISHLCPSGTGSFSVGAVAGATQYRWTVPAGFSINGGGATAVTGRNVTISAPSSYAGSLVQVKVRAERPSDACYANSAERVKHLTYGTFSANIQGATTVNPLEGRYYQLDPNGLANFQWSLPSGWLLQSGQGTHAIMVKTGAGPAQSGKVRVTYTSCGTTFSRELNVNIVNDPVLDPGFGKKSLDESSVISISPNPTADMLRIRTEAGSTLRLVNLQGAILMEQANVGQETEMSIGHLAAGIYFLEVQTGATSSMLKVLKK